MKGQSVQKIHLDMKKVLENDAPSHATFYRWAAALSMINSPLKTSTVLIACLTYVRKKC